MHTDRQAFAAPRLFAGGHAKTLSRRDALRLFGAAALAGAALGAAGCSMPSPGAITLYSSVDSEFLDPVVSLFTRQRGLDVLVVGDTEATKTTGLVQRLINEKANPRADVFWSSEALGSVRLSEAGILAPFTANAAETDLAGSERSSWPVELRDPAKAWYGFAERARVLVIAKDRVPADKRPRLLTDMITGPHAAAFAGRIGIAAPQFGTTRGHLAALVSESGEAAVAAFIKGLKAQRVRIYPGNGNVVRAVAEGQIDLGLTDTDDVYSGRRNGWPIDIGWVGGLDDQHRGALLVPNTIGLVRGSRRVVTALEFVEHVLSGAVQELLAASTSGNIPVLPSLRTRFASLRPPMDAGERSINWTTAAKSSETALDLWQATFG